MKRNRPDLCWQLCRCGKRGYPVRADARHVARRIRRRFGPKDGAECVDTYLCHRTRSGLWHVGNGTRKGENLNDPNREEPE